MKSSTGNLIGLVIVTAVAVVMMVTVSASSLTLVLSIEDDASIEAQLTKTSVAVIEVTPEHVEVVHAYPGKVIERDRFQFAFELPGRIIALGVNDRGEPLDKGDHVRAGQELAYLDTVSLRADLEQAQSNWNTLAQSKARADEMRARGSGLMSDDEYDTRVQQLADAKAMLDRVNKSLENSTLRSTVDGIISRRFLKPGESVNAHQTVFEVLEMDPMLLVVGVPDSRVLNIRPGQRVYITLEARDEFGRPLQELEGTVSHISPAGSQQTSLFDVEVLVANPNYELRSGLIATAQIVVDQFEGYRLPHDSVIFRESETFLYAVDERSKAVKLPLNNWVQQGPDVIVPELPEPLRTVVVRGHRRLVDGRDVEVVEVLERGSSPPLTAEAPHGSAAANP